MSVRRHLNSATGSAEPGVIDEDVLAGLAARQAFFARVLGVLTTNAIASDLVPSQDDDGLDPLAWERLRTVVMAASAGDRQAFKGEIACWASSSPLAEQHRVGLYLLGAVRYMVKVFVRGDPGEAELKNIAARCFAEVEKVLTAHLTAVEDALRIAFDLPAIRRELRPGELVVLFAAVAGALLNQLGAELGEVRDWVAGWWKLNAQPRRQTSLAQPLATERRLAA